MSLHLHKWGTWADERRVETAHYWEDLYSHTTLHLVQVRSCVRCGETRSRKVNL